MQYLDLRCYMVLIYENPLKLWQEIIKSFAYVLPYIFA